ncbi:MAG: O-antigen ligase family protein [Halobacteriovoraceae bacterium]|nr:O-antigen ligase family protein [Halobacteriovoraceae bacterium]
MIYHPLNSSTFGYGIKLGNLFIMLIFLLNIHKKSLDLAHHSLLFAGTFFTLFFCFDYLQQSNYITGSISFSGHIICLNAIIALYYQSKNRLSQVLKYLVIIIALYILYVTQRRLALIQLLMASTIYVAFSLKKARFQVKLITSGLTIILMAVVFLSSSPKLYKYNKITSFLKTPNYQTFNSASTTRANLALTALDIISKKPLKGIGIHGRSLNKFSLANLDSYNLHSHNEVIQQALQSGILNAFIQLILMGILIFLVIRTVNLPRDLNHISVIGIITCLFNWLFTRHYIDPLSRMYFIFFFCLLVKKYSPTKFNISKLPIGIFGIFSIICLSSIFLAKSYEKKSLRSHNFGEKLDNTKKSLSYDSYSPRVLYNYAKMCLSIKDCNEKYLNNFYTIYPENYLSNLGQYYMSPKKDIHFWSKALEKAPQSKKKYVENFLID